MRSLIKVGLCSTLLCACGVQGEKLVEGNQSGSLNLSEKNNLAAEIFVDGISTGLRTPAQVKGLTEGKHQISLWLSGYQIAHDSLNIVQGQSKNLEFNLNKLSSTVEVNVQTSSGAEIWLDGLRLGESNALLSGLSSGKHQLKLSYGNQVLDTLIDLDQVKAPLKLIPQSKNWVLLEHFSNIACMPCPSVDRAVEAFLHEQKNPRIVHLAMHTNSPSPEDLFYTPFASSIDERVGPKYYAVASVPRVMLNGVKTGARQDSLAIPQYLKDSIPVLLNSSVKLNLALTKISQKNNQISGQLELSAFAGVEGRVKVALVEDELHFASAPGINGLSDFIDMFRGFASMSADQVQLNAGSSQTIAWAVAQPAQGRNYSLVAWVENPNTKSILQVYKQSLPHFTQE